MFIAGRKRLNSILLAFIDYNENLLTEIQEYSGILMHRLSDLRTCF